MILPVVMLAAALGQQPARAPAQAPDKRRLAAFDTTGAAVTAVGDRVAEVKSALDLFRRAVFNAPDAEVLGTADLFAQRCHGLDSTATAASRRICRSCVAAKVNAALGGYRQIMPAVARTGARCASRLRQLLVGPSAGKRLRADVRNVGNAVVAGLVPYEQRLRVLREALGAVPPNTIPPRRPPRGSKP
jgi:hypothetical protein